MSIRKEEEEIRKNIREYSKALHEADRESEADPENGEKEDKVIKMMNIKRELLELLMMVIKRRKEEEECCKKFMETGDCYCL